MISQSGQAVSETASPDSLNGNQERQKAMDIRVIEEILSDGSKLYNVVMKTNGYIVTCGCISSASAEWLATSLNETAWVAIDSAD